MKRAVIVDCVRTPIGRATILVLKINSPFHVELRRTLIEEGAFPLDD